MIRSTYTNVIWHERMLAYILNEEKDHNNVHVQDIFIANLRQADEVRNVVNVERYSPNIDIKNRYNGPNFHNTVSSIVANLASSGLDPTADNINVDTNNYYGSNNNNDRNQQRINSMGSSSHQSNTSRMDNLERQLRLINTSINGSNPDTEVSIDDIRQQQIQPNIQYQHQSPPHSSIHNDNRLDNTEPIHSLRQHRDADADADADNNNNDDNDNDNDGYNGYIPRNDSQSSLNIKNMMDFLRAVQK